LDWVGKRLAIVFESRQGKDTPVNTLTDVVKWTASEHSGHSRGMLKGAPFLANNPPLRFEGLVEEGTVMTRKISGLFTDKSRTTVIKDLLPENVAGISMGDAMQQSFNRGPAQAGVLSWKTTDESILAHLHTACVEIISEVGFTEFCLMCEAHGPHAPIYWQEMLGENFRYLKKWE
jgi:hypothetical protein